MNPAHVARGFFAVAALVASGLAPYCFEAQVLAQEPAEG